MAWSGWGAVIGAVGSILGGLLQKKGKDEAKGQSAAALKSANEARKAALEQLSGTNIDAIIAQFFPGLGGSGGSPGTARAPSAGPGANPSATTGNQFGGVSGAGGRSAPGSGMGFNAGEHAFSGAPNTDSGAFAAGEGVNPTFQESYPGQAAEMTAREDARVSASNERGRVLADWLIKNVVGIPGVPKMAGRDHSGHVKGAGPPGGFATTGADRAWMGGQAPAMGGRDAAGANPVQPIGYYSDVNGRDVAMHEGNFRGGSSQAFFNESQRYGPGGDRYVPPSSGGSCFHGDTEVLTPSGPRPIRSLKADDLVIGGDGAPSPVLVQRILPATAFYRINGTLLVTGEHPFAVMDRGVRNWKQARHLAVGDTLVSHSGEPVVVQSIGTELHSDMVDVYNPGTGSTHTYFVLLNGAPVLVHNKEEQTLHFMAQGGNAEPGETVMVGEQGPEIVNLPAGGTVVPNPGTPLKAATPIAAPGTPQLEQPLSTQQPPLGGPLTTPSSGAPPPGPGGIVTGTPPPRPKPAAAPNTGSLVSNAINDVLSNPGKTSPAGYERDVANANQALNASRMAISGELSGAGVDPSSGAGQFELQNAVGQAHRSRNDASQKQAQREETLRREDLDRGIKDYMAALQMSFNLAAAKASAIAGQAFPQVQPIDTYAGLASGVSSLGYFLGQAMGSSGTGSTTSTSSGAGPHAAA